MKATLQSEEQSALCHHLASGGIVEKRVSKFRVVQVVAHYLCPVTERQGAY